MAEQEFYRLELKVGITGDEQVKGKLSAMDKFIEHTKKRGEMLNRTKISPTARLIDRISGPARIIQASLSRICGVHKVIIKAVDQATSVVKRITSSLTSPLVMMGGGAGIYGLGKLTIGPAAQFERYTVSMEHWLKGNKTLAQETMKWVEGFADVTPFTTEELFPGMARAINIEKGMVEPAKRLVKLSGEMAALTPGKTVLDAMEALADAQMGEFERMKEFGMKVSQEEFKALGGWKGFLRKAENTFSGGMKGLSKTSSGLLSTILDKIQSLFRTAGVGMLEAIKPRLEKITEWFDKNKKTVERWKDNLARLGKEAFEKMFSWGERFLSKIDKKLESPAFKNADWGTKLAVILDEAVKVALPKAGEVGIKLGLGLGKGLGKGIAKAVAEDPLLGAILGIWLGSKVPGPIQLKIAVALAVAGVPQIVKGAEVIQKKTAPFIEKKITPIMKRITYVPSSEEKRKQHWLYKITKALGGARAVGEKAHATGGILTRPHLGMVAEAGPEAIIPLSAGKRSRAIDVFKQTADILGLSRVGNLISLDVNKKTQGQLSGAANAVQFTNLLSTKLETAKTKIVPMKPEFDIFTDAPEINIAKQIGERIKTNTSEKVAIVMNKLKEVTSGVSFFVSKLVNNIKDMVEKTQVSTNIFGPKEMMPQVQNIAARFGLPPTLLAAVIQAESGWNPRAVSPAGAIGLTQVMPGTAKAMGYNPAELIRNPALQIEAGAKYLSQMIWKFKSIPLALAAYNAGPGAIERFGGIPPYPETQAYVSRIMSSLTKHATGGILTRPHLGIVAEAGPEAIIPLSSRLRTRALNLWQQTGEHLNVKPYALGGFVGQIPAIAGAVSSGNINVSVSGITVNISDNEIDEETLALRIGRQIVTKIKRTMENKV